MKITGDLFVTAVIVAAGKGTRMNMDINKQYIKICGKPILVRTLEIFERCSAVNEVVVIVNEQDIEYCSREMIKKYSLSKVAALTAGGSTRQQSVYNGLMRADSRCSIVLVHDGARPFVSEASIIGSIEAALEHGCSVVAVPVKDTIKKADDGGLVEQTLDRSYIWSVQTPQTFKYNIALEAHSKAVMDDFVGTDDSMLAERLGYKPRLVMGSYDNIKITTQEDLVAAEAILLKKECKGALK